MEDDDWGKRMGFHEGRGREMQNLSEEAGPLSNRVLLWSIGSHRSETSADDEIVTLPTSH